MANREQRTDVVVIGAGVSGLIAASTLVPATDVLVLEAAARPGGRVESVRHGDYWVNVGAQFAEGTGALFEAMDRLDLARVSLADKKAALALNGRTVAMDSPAGLVLRSRMSLSARVEFARFGLRIRRAHKRLVTNKDRDDARAFRARLDARPGSELVSGLKSREVLQLFSDLSGQWIGCEPEETAATQLVFSIGTALEKAAAVPNFSLPVGGNQTLVDVLAADLGDRLRLSSEVHSVKWSADGVIVEYTDERGPATLHARRAVIAVPADRALTMLPGLPEEQRSALGNIEYGRYVIAGFFTTERGRQPWDEYYTISTPDLGFQAIFNHAAALRGHGARTPGGALVCFSGGHRADEQLGWSDAEIEAAYIGDLVGLFPTLKDQIERVVIRRQRRVVPFWRPGDRASVRALREPVGPIHFAGDYLLGVPSLADAAASGKRAADEVLQQL